MLLRGDDRLRAAAGGDDDDRGGDDDARRRRRRSGYIAGIMSPSFFSPSAVRGFGWAGPTTFEAILALELELDGALDGLVEKK